MAKAAKTKTKTSAGMPAKGKAKTKAGAPREWICSTLDTPAGARVSTSAGGLRRAGVADREKLWPRGTKLTVWFMSGSAALQKRVLKAAQAWFDPGIKLELAAAPRINGAHIRIDFDPDDGSWSYIGTDCLGIRPSAPTMNLGWATMDASDSEFNSVVLHEFGHALGLLHEHNHPHAQIKWNAPNVIADLSGPPNNWSSRTIADNVFAKFDESKVIVTDFDKASIMIYPIPSRWTTDSASFTPSSKLSKGDIEAIKALYG